MAPSRLLTIIRAVSHADPVNCRLPSAWPCSRTRCSQVSFWSKNRITVSCIAAGSVWYSAASMPHRHIRRSAQYLEVQPDVAVELGGRVSDAGIQVGQRLGEARRVASYERLPEFGLAGEVVVQGRLVICSSAATSA